MVMVCLLAPILFEIVARLWANLAVEEVREGGCIAWCVLKLWLSHCPIQMRQFQTPGRKDLIIFDKSAHTLEPVYCSIAIYFMKMDSIGHRKTRIWQILSLFKKTKFFPLSLFRLQLLINNLAKNSVLFIMIH